MKYTIAQIITMYLDWMDEKPIGYDCDYDNEDLGEQFERCFNLMEDSDQSNINLHNNQNSVCPYCESDKIGKRLGEEIMFCWNCNRSWQTK